MLVLEGTSNTGIGGSIAKALGAELSVATEKIFPDGESEIQISARPKGQDVIIVQTTYPFQDKRLLQLFLMTNQMRKAGAKSITAVVPYLAYAREDRSYEGKNNVVSISAVLELLGREGAGRLVTVAPHKKESLSGFTGKSIAIDPIAVLSGSIKGELRSPFVLAPDRGALHLAEEAAGVLGCGYAHIDKQRDRNTGETSIIGTPKDDIKGRDVVIIDDIISTGGTAAQAAEFAVKHGARSVSAAAVHLVMAGGAHERLKAAGVSEVYGTNTISYDKAKLVDISELIARSI